MRLRDIFGIDANLYRIVEALGWFALAIYLFVNSGKTAKELRRKLGGFINWFAVKGFYADAYVALKKVYTDKDSRAIIHWLEARQLGKIAIKIYTDLLQSQEYYDYEYAKWTNYTYLAFFGIKAKDMKEIWELMDGTGTIARNYTSKAEGLDVVCYCEDMVVRMFIEDLEEAHEMDVNLTKRKFLGGS